MKVGHPEDCCVVVKFIINNNAHFTARRASCLGFCVRGILRGQVCVRNILVAYYSPVSEVLDAVGWVYQQKTVNKESPNALK